MIIHTQKGHGIEKKKKQFLCLQERNICKAHFKGFTSLVSLVLIHCEACNRLNFKNDLDFCFRDMCSK